MQNTNTVIKVLAGDYSPEFGRIVVREQDYHGERVRMLLLNRGQESACYTDPARRHELVFNYTQQVDRIFRAIPDLCNTLVIGGAGFSYPRYYLTTYPERTMTVVELNPAMVDMARRFFYLDEFAEEEASGRLDIRIDDGLHFLSTGEKCFDAIYNDAFVGEIADGPLQTPEAIELIRQRLNTDGIYLVNIITARTGRLAAPWENQRHLLLQHFKNCELIPCDAAEPSNAEQNCILLASDRPLDWIYKLF